MSGKTLILVIAVSATSLVAVAARRDRPAEVEAMPGRARITATVEVESLRVISYLDEDGNWRAPDSALVPPVPLEGPRQIAIAPGRAPVQLAERVGPR